jgi:hypothetical protein
MFRPRLGKPFVSDERQQSGGDAAEEAQAAIRDGIERARELLCEAKLTMSQTHGVKVEPPLSLN